MQQQNVDMINEAAQRQRGLVTTLRDAFLGWIDEERRKVQQLQAATAKSDISVEQVLREIDGGLGRVQREVRERIHA